MTTVMDLLEMIGEGNKCTIVDKKNGEEINFSYTSPSDWEVLEIKADNIGKFTAIVDVVYDCEIVREEYYHTMFSEYEIRENKL